MKHRDPAVVVASPSALARRRATALFLGAAGASFLFSVLLWFTGNREEGLFVGLWVPSILSLGAMFLAQPDRDR